MNPMLTVLKQEYRADELRDRAERERRWLVNRRHKRSGRAAPQTFPAVAPAPLNAERLILGREHTAPA